jgi:hypothetical protein
MHLDGRGDKVRFCLDAPALFSPSLRRLAIDLRSEHSEWFHVTQILVMFDSAGYLFDIA